MYKDYSYKFDEQIPQAMPNRMGFSIMPPIGGLNKSVPPSNVEDVETPDALNKWINSSGRMATFFGNTAFSAVLEADSTITRQYKFKKDATTTYNIVAWDNGVNLKLGYLDSAGVKTDIDVNLTTGEDIVFETYLNRDGTELDSGTATAGTTDTLTDSAATWVEDAYKAKVLYLDGGTGSGQAQVIESNTATIITVKNDWTTNPDATTTYQILELAYSLYYMNSEDGLKEWDGVSTSSVLGDSTTQFDITNPSGDTFRYTYDGTGTDPALGDNLVVGSNLNIQAENFSAGNNGFCVVVAKDTNYFEIERAGGVVESDKTIGTGSITKLPAVSLLSAPAGDCMKIFKDILFIAKDSTLYASSEWNPSDWSKDWFGIIGNENPEPITNIGLYKGNFVVFKQRSNIIVTPTESSGDLLFLQSDIDETRGCKNNKSLVEADGELIVLDEFGVYNYGYAPQVLVLGVQERLTDKIKPLLSDTTTEGLFYDTEHDVIFLTCSDTLLLYDWKRRTLATAWWELDMAVNTFLVIGSTVYFGASDEARVYKIDEAKYLTGSYCYSKAWDAGSEFPKIFDFLKFTAKNIAGKVGLKVIFGLLNEARVVRDVSIYVGTAGSWSGGVGFDPIGFVGIGLGTEVAEIVLQLLKRRVTFPFYHSAYVQLKWYNDDDTNFELESYSLHGELLSTDHDSLSIYF